MVSLHEGYADVIYGKIKRASTILAVIFVIALSLDWLMTHRDESVSEETCRDITGTRDRFLLRPFHPTPTQDQLDARDRCLRQDKEGISISDGGVFLKEWYLELANHQVRKKIIESSAKGFPISETQERRLREETSAKFIAEARLVCSVSASNDNSLRERLNLPIPGQPISPASGRKKLEAADKQNSAHARCWAI